MDRFGSTGKVSKKLVHLLRGPLFPVGPVGILIELKCACVTAVINVGRAVLMDPTLLR